MLKSNSKNYLIFIISLLSTVLFATIYFLFPIIFSKDLSEDNAQNLTPQKFDASIRIHYALESYKTNTTSPSILSSVNAIENVVSLTFDGVVDRETTDLILDMLDKYSVKATFFLSGIKSAEDTYVIKRILDHEHKIGNYTLSAKKDMSLLSEQEIIEDLCRASEILESVVPYNVSILKFNTTEYTDNLLLSAGACNIEYVVKSSNIVNYQSFSNYDMTLSYFSKLKPGSILSFKLDEALDTAEYEQINTEETPAINKQASISIETAADSITKSKEEKLLQVIEWILQAASETKTTFVSPKELSLYHFNNFWEQEDFILINSFKIEKERKDYSEIRKSNQEQKASIITNLYTSQPAVSYIFRGITDWEKMEPILDALDSLNAKATFFVTGNEILTQHKIIDEIVLRGHTLGNGGYGNDNRNPKEMTYDEISYEIDMGKQILEAYLNENLSSDNLYYMPLYADAGGYVTEAASALGYNNVVTYSKTTMSSKYKYMTADEIIKDYFANTISLHRGEVIYFRTDYLVPPRAIDDFVYKVAYNFVNPSGYNIVPIHSLLESPLVYEPTSRADAKGSQLIKTSYNYGFNELDNKIFSNTIGDPNSTTSEKLIGFTDEEINKIDTTGRIDTNGEKVIFLTFDDWGSDIIINKILSVLKKHDAKASFFVRVGYADLPFESSLSNPNLLRAIAMDGHDVANHTFRHMQSNISTQEEKALLQQDIVAAHREMSRYIGDTGALKLYFRPPTLAVSKLGLQTIFDTGYKYVVNGDFSTRDYEAESTEALVNTLINGIDKTNSKIAVSDNTPIENIRKIAPGSIVVLHMSDNSKYTPEALDIVIPYYLKQGYKFEKLSTYLK
jgi:peptidoglycan/xylan/chitin deacetylase (PgdA/CDA1 family)